MNLENKTITRNGSHFCKYCKINGAWLGAKFMVFFFFVKFNIMDRF